MEPVVIGAIITGVCMVLAAILGRNRTEAEFRRRKERRIRSTHRELQQVCPHTEVLEQPLPGKFRVVAMSLFEVPETSKIKCSVCGSEFPESNDNWLRQRAESLEGKELGRRHFRAYRLREKLDEETSE